MDITLKIENSESWESLELSWLPEVGGDFLGVPTEAPSDTLVMPVRNEGLSDHPIGYNEDAIWKAGSDWWAIVDRIQRFAFAVRVIEGPAFELHQWSGKVGALDTLRETMRFPLQRGTSILRLRIFFFTAIDHLMAMGDKVAFNLTQGPSGKPELSIMVAAPISNAQLRVLRESGAEILSTTLPDLTPATPHRLPLPEGSDASLKLEWTEDGVSTLIPLTAEK